MASATGVPDPSTTCTSIDCAGSIVNRAGGSATGGAIQVDGDLSFTNSSLGALGKGNLAQGGNGGNGDLGGAGGNGLGGGLTQTSGDLIADAIQALYNQATGGNGGTGWERDKGGVGGAGGNGNGGGFYIANGATLALTNSTIQYNKAIAGNGGPGSLLGKRGANGNGQGGGVYLGGPGSTVDTATVITLNQATDNTTKNIFGTFN